MNRAWTAWGLDDALKGARDAGCSTIGLIAAHQGKHLIGADATVESLDAIKRKLADSGLELVVTALRIQENDTPRALQDDVRRQIDNSARLGTRFIMTFGVDRPANYTKFEQVMTDAAARAEAAKVKLVIKPHGGIAYGPAEILRCVEHVGHPNFSVWYDPGNILHYTGADPVEAYVPLAKHVTGFCAKDCARRSGEVMMTIGEGKVDFPALFARMAATGFDGPILIEGIKVGKTPDETTANAEANRLALERAMATGAQ
jgi:sugar phosphate isomerase/epimerase